jgi:hypothetical protein
LAALAVLLILLGALGATMLVLQVGNRVEVVKVTADIQAGQSVGNNVTSVMVAADDSLNYVKWSQVDALKALKARSTIYANTVVMGQMFGSDAGVEAGKALVGLSLKAGQFPNGVKAGDIVAAYRVASETGSGTGSASGSSSSSTGGNSLIVDRATVASVPDDKGSGDFTSSTNKAYTLSVDSSKAAALAQAASNGQVALVLVSSK